jgi:hypothetical protein
VERFEFSYKRYTRYILDPKLLKLVLLKGVREEWMEILDLIENCNISQLSCDEIKKVLKNYSRVENKKSK